MQSAVDNHSKPANDTIVHVERPQDKFTDPNAKPAPFAVVGRTERDDGPAILAQVFVNVQAGKSGKNGTDCLPLHEIPLARAKQMQLGGGRVTILPGFAPLMPQVRPMTKAALIRELERLRGKQNVMGGPFEDGKYIIARGEQMVNLFPNIYGGDHGSKLTLFDKMAEFARGWAELEQNARDDARIVTIDDIEALIAKVCPSQASDELDNLPSMLVAKTEMAIATAVTKDPELKTLDGDPRLSEWLTLHHKVRPEDAVAAALVYAGVRKGLKEDDKVKDPVWKKVDCSIIPAIKEAKDPLSAKKRSERFIELLIKWDKLPKMA